MFDILKLEKKHVYLLTSTTTSQLNATKKMFLRALDKARKGITKMVLPTFIINKL